MNRLENIKVWKKSIDLATSFYVLINNNQKLQKDY
jgi:hypothetical protein